MHPLSNFLNHLLSVFFSLSYSLSIDEVPPGDALSSGNDRSADDESKRDNPVRKGSEYTHTHTQFTCESNGRFFFLHLCLDSLELASLSGYIESRGTFGDRGEGARVTPGINKTRSPSLSEKGKCLAP